MPPRSSSDASIVARILNKWGTLSENGGFEIDLHGSLTIYRQHRLAFTVSAAMSRLFFRGQLVRTGVIPRVFHVIHLIHVSRLIHEIHPTHIIHPIRLIHMIHLIYLVNLIHLIHLINLTHPINPIHLIHLIHQIHLLHLIGPIHLINPSTKFTSQRTQSV